MYLFLLGLLMPFFSDAQQKHNHQFVCSYYGESLPASIHTYASTNQAETIIKEIIDVVGLKPKFSVRSAKIPNAAAMVYGGSRYVLYNPGFISSIDKAAGNYWAGISILAHEIGHHLNGHTLQGGSRPANELEADEFSGFVMRKLGATLNEAQLAMQIVANNRASTTHPAKHDRLAAIATGWQNGAAKQEARSILAKLPQPSDENVIASPVADIRNNSRQVLADKHIRFDVTINSDRSTDYYITTGNNFVRIHNNRLEILGQLVATNRTDYPLGIWSENKLLFLVSAKGQIVNIKGMTVGFLQSHETTRG